MALYQCYEVPAASHMGQKQFATISHYSAGELCRHHLHHLQDELIIIPTPHYAPFGLRHTLNRES